VSAELDELVGEDGLWRESPEAGAIADKLGWMAAIVLIMTSSSCCSARTSEGSSSRP
jgi:hypothetical protein